MAFQDCIALITDLEGNIINNIYDMSDKNVVSEVHVCVFPLEESSVVMLFVDSQDKKYRKFYKQFTKLTQNDKLGIVNYMIFLYSENIFISKEIDESVLNNENLADAAKQTEQIFLDDDATYDDAPYKEMLETASSDFNLMNWGDVPNLLSEEYALT